MTYGNLAYKYDYREDNRQKKQKKVKINGKNSRKKKKNTKELGYPSKILLVLTAAVSAVFMISQFVEVNESETKLSEAKDRYRFEESVTAQKTFELEQSIDLSKIEKEATTRLGMHRPDRHQMVYLNVRRDDVTEKTAGEVEGFKNRFVSFCGSIISNIVDFFSI